MLKPLLDRVLLQKVEEENITKSGLIISDKSKELPNTGKVIAVGPGKITESGEKIEMQVQVGDVVIFKQYATTEVNYDNEKFVLVDMKDILAIVE